MQKWLAMILCLALPGVWAGEAPAADLTVAAAINKAGRQRMLSQRIVKAYCQLGLRVLPHASQTQLNDAVKLFDAQLGELKAFAPHQRIRDALVKVEKLWRPFKATATGMVNREGAQKLLAVNDDLLDAAQVVTVLLQEFSGTSQGFLVNISGRQRMLSQRLAKFYMLRAWGFDTPGVRDDMESAKREFEGALKVLQAAPENTDAINQELDSVALQWEWFQTALAQEGAYTSYRLVVADSSESMLSSLEKVTMLYEELSGRP